MIIKTCSFITRHKNADRIIMEPNTGVPICAIYNFANYRPHDKPEDKIAEIQEMLDQVRQQLTDAGEIIMQYLEEE